MTLLKKGRGGFEVDEKAISAANPTLVATTQPERTPSKIFQWVDASGRLQVSDQPPPKGSQAVKTFEGASN
jgi:hypothetical protein